MTTREVSNEKGITETSRENGLTITKQGFHTARFSANISAEHGKLFAPTIVGNTLILTQGNLLLTARLIRADPSNLNPELQKLVDVWRYTDAQTAWGCRSANAGLLPPGALAMRGRCRTIS